MRPARARNSRGPPGRAGEALTFPVVTVFVGAYAMASILVFYDGTDVAELKQFEEQCLRPEGWGVGAQRLSQGAFRIGSANVNMIKIERLRKSLHKGTLRWVTVEDDEIREGRP
jgi:hypothetical protein